MCSVLSVSVSQSDLSLPVIKYQDRKSPKCSTQGFKTALHYLMGVGTVAWPSFIYRLCTFVPTVSADKQCHLNIIKPIKCHHRHASRADKRFKG